MPVCAVSNPTWENSEVINPTPTDVDFTMLKNGTLHFILDNSQTVYFKFYFTSLTPNQSVSIQISIYSANSFALISSLTSSETNIETNIDLQAGTYIICIRSLRGSYKGTATAQYFGFSRVVSLSPEVGESGQECNFNLTVDGIRKPCDKDMQWEIVEGTLPQGLVLDKYSGVIRGTLPYLDCLPDDDGNLFSEVASANLFFTNEHHSGMTVEPWGRRWQFKLRISMVEQPEHYDEQSFCISIYNNWTRTERKFLDAYEEGIELKDIITKVEMEKPKYKFGLCPPDPCNIDKDVDDVLDVELNEWDGVDSDDDVIHIELALNKNLSDSKKIQDSNKIGETPRTYVVYKSEDGNKTKEMYEVDDDGKYIPSVYIDHHATIDIDEDIIDQGNMYDSFIADGVTQGYIQETITIELFDYEHYLGFRLWANKNLKTHPLIKEYEYNKLFLDFLRGGENVEHEYIFAPADNSDNDDDFKFEDKHFIYISYNVDKLPEAKYLEDMINAEKEKGPWDVMCTGGDRATFELN